MLGTNGAGKTTTIRMILGILAKDSGIITWDGKPITRETVNFGYLPEERGIYPKAKVAEQLIYFAKLRGLDGKTILKGNLKEIKNGYGRTNLAINCNESIDDLIHEEGIHITSKNATGYELKIKTENQAYSLLEKMLQQKYKLDKFEIREPSLDEIFIEKVGDSR